MSIKENRSYSHLKVPGYIYELCRQFRKNQTNAEILLWDCLRGKRLSGLKFRRQHPIGRYVVDFYCPEKKLAIELEGGVYKLQRQKEYDTVRIEEIESMGLKVLRFSNEEVFSDLEKVLAIITSPLNPLSTCGEGTVGEG